MIQPSTRMLLPLWAGCGSFREESSSFPLNCWLQIKCNRTPLEENRYCRWEASANNSHNKFLKNRSSEAVALLWMWSLWSTMKPSKKQTKPRAKISHSELQEDYLTRSLSRSLKWQTAMAPSNPASKSLLVSSLDACLPACLSVFDCCCCCCCYCCERSSDNNQCSLWALEQSCA